MSDFRGSIDFTPSPDGGTLVFEANTVPLMSLRMIDTGNARQLTVYGPYAPSKMIKRHRLDAVRACL